jgi:hypothetical protein
MEAVHPRASRTGLDAKAAEILVPGGDRLTQQSAEQFRRVPLFQR